jgi:hypothetical protein
MASPFPGMDPYLEDPSIWPSAHHLLITHIGTTLNSLLSPRYIATFQERIFVAGPDRNIYPDVLVREGAETGTWKASVRNAATPAIGDPPWFIATIGDEVVESYIELRTAIGGQRVVTVIEVLSPRNKAAGSEGRRLYRQKQQEVLDSDTHLLEIDLLRSGQHTVAAPRDALLRRGPYRYLVSLSRSHQRHQCEVWGILLSSPLPRVNVPLAGTDPDIILDLQAVWQQVYAAGAFERIIDYTQPPTIPFDDDDARWADECLRRSGDCCGKLPEAQGSVPDSEATDQEDSRTR